MAENSIKREREIRTGWFECERYSITLPELKYSDPLESPAFDSER